LGRKRRFLARNQKNPVNFPVIGKTGLREPRLRCRGAPLGSDSLPMRLPLGVILCT
jgi:hypothetical protein